MVERTAIEYSISWLNKEQWKDKARDILNNPKHDKHVELINLLIGINEFEIKIIELIEK